MDIDIDDDIEIKTERERGRDIYICRYIEIYKEMYFHYLIFKDLFKAKS